MRQRRSATGLAVAAAMAAVLVGCGSGPAGRAAQQAGNVRAAAIRSAPPPGPPVAGRAEAEKLGLHLLSALVLPPGASRLRQRPVPASLRRAGVHIGAFPDVSPYRLYRLPVSLSAAISFLRAHLPHRQVSQGVPVSTDDGVVVNKVLLARVRGIPAGISAAELEYTVVPDADGASMLRVDAQVAWYPPRPAAEVFVAARYRSAVLGYSDPGGEHGSMTITSRPLISKLVGLIDDLHVGSSFGCTVQDEELSVQLTPAAAGEPAATVSTGGCNDYQVYAGKTMEPALSAPRTGLAALIARLLKVPSVP